MSFGVSTFIVSMLSGSRLYPYGLKVLDLMILALTVLYNIFLE